MEKKTSSNYVNPEKSELSQVVLNSQLKDVVINNREI